MDKEKKEVSSSTDADGSVAVAALVRKTLGFGQLQPGEAQASSSLLHYYYSYMGKAPTLAPLARWVADA